MPPQLTKEQRAHWCSEYLADRQRARTDLFYLANEILAPSDSKIMTRRTHGVIVDHCQQFTGYKELMDPESMRLVASECVTPMYELTGSRERLLLASRGTLKTTIQVIAHSIQWMLNYPNVRILICTATDDKAQMVVGEMKRHFQFNPKLRFLFPDWCPPARKAGDWGSRTEFTVPNRTRHAKEPSVMTASIGKALASTHHDVIKPTDAVTENNVGTPGQLQDTENFFGYIEPLRERGESLDGEPNPGWLDIEGTIYDFGDYHSKLADKIRANPKSRYRFTHQSCWLDKDNRLPWWPERLPAKELDRIRDDIGIYLFASQYELDPVPPGEGLATIDDIRFFPVTEARKLMAHYTSVETTVDLAGMDPNNTRADYTVFNTAARQRDGRLDVLAIQRGRFSDEQVIELFFMIQAMYPANEKFKIQKDHLAVGLASGLRREMEKRGKWLFIEPTAISTTESKKYKIKKSLQGWFKMGLIRFSDGIGSKETGRETVLSRALINEILRFPKGENDDILDTLADHFMDRDGDPAARAVPQSRPEMTRDRICDHSNSVACPLCLPAPGLYGERHEDSFSDCYAEVTGI